MKFKDILKLLAGLLLFALAILIIIKPIILVYALGVGIIIFGGKVKK